MKLKENEFVKENVVGYAVVETNRKSNIDFMYRIDEDDMMTFYFADNLDNDTKEEIAEWFSLEFSKNEKENAPDVTFAIKIPGGYIVGKESKEMNFPGILIGFSKNKQFDYNHLLTKVEYEKSLETFRTDLFADGQEEVVASFGHSEGEIF